MNVEALASALRSSRSFRHKTDLVDVLRTFERASATSGFGPAGLGDDCAVIADRGDHLLFAVEGFVEDFVQQMPWFAGYCGVMVNVSDVYAMGGRPVAVVDALWSHAPAATQELLQGMIEASQVYGVPIVGGHTIVNARTAVTDPASASRARAQLAVAILGRAGRAVLSSFNARAGDHLLMAVDLRGRYHDPYPYWDASTGSPAQRLRDDLEILPRLAEAGICDAAKDISMAGCIGTALMLLECSQVGACIDIDAIPRPQQDLDELALLRWLSAFPSYGFLLSLRPQHLQAAVSQFHERGIAVADVGTVTATRQVSVQLGGRTATLWDFEREAFMAATPANAQRPPRAIHG
jgi:AIR synthase-related protein